MIDKKNVSRRRVRRPRSVAGGVDIGVFDEGWMNMLVILVFVTGHGKHLRHGVIDTFFAVISTRVVGAGREFIHGSCRLSAELRSVIGRGG